MYLSQSYLNASDRNGLWVKREFVGRIWSSRDTRIGFRAGKGLRVLLESRRQVLFFGLIRVVLLE